MKVQESLENYLEAILMLSKKQSYVRAIDIAKLLDFSKPSISIAMKKMKDNGYIEMEGSHILLSEKGQQIAESVYERHTILTDWLISIGVDATVAADDACRMEHVISPETFEAIKKQFQK